MITKVKGNTYISNIEGTCTGFYILDNKEVVLIDSGRYPSDELLQWLNRERMSVAAIIHTHLHIDHIANTSELYNKYACELYACEGEKWDDDDDYMEMIIRFNKPSEPIDIRGFRFRTVFTPGHSDGHQLVITPDGVCFVGDAILTDEVLNASKLPYMKDIREAIVSMGRIREVQFTHFVASHNGVILGNDLGHVVNRNMNKHYGLYDQLIKTASVPLTEEELAEQFMIDIGVENPEVRAYFWMQATTIRRIEELLESQDLIKFGEMIKANDEMFF